MSNKKANAIDKLKEVLGEDLFNQFVEYSSKEGENEKETLTRINKEYEKVSVNYAGHNLFMKVAAIFRNRDFLKFAYRYVDEISKNYSKGPGYISWRVNKWKVQAEVIMEGQKEMVSLMNKFEKVFKKNIKKISFTDKLYGIDLPQELSCSRYGVWPLHEYREMMAIENYEEMGDNMYQYISWERVLDDELNKKDRAQTMQEFEERYL